MEFEENNQTQDASFPEKPNETPAQDMPGAEAEESSRQPDAQARREKQYKSYELYYLNRIIQFVAGRYSL